jgi:lipoyl(octanoyl) transferase
MICGWERYSISVLFEKLCIIQDETPHCAAVNMAIDEILLAELSEPLLRIYRWEKPAVSFGYFIRFSAVCDVARSRELVRRMTGGGIVEHGSDLTYSVILPSVHPLAECPPRESYAAIHRAIAGWMQHRGIATALAPSAGAGTATVCFDSPAEFDLIAGLQKVAGAAQRRTRTGLLHQGSVQLPGVTDADRTGFATAFTEVQSTVVLEPSILDAARALAKKKYALQSWTERV